MSVSTVTTDIEVANMALDKCKETPISSMSDNRSVARWMSRNYVKTRNLVMTAVPWKFALERVELDPDAQDPLWEWTYRYAKPADALRVLPLRQGGAMNGRPINHQIEGDFILTNQAPKLRVRYIKLIDTEADWPVQFVEALACKLAADISHYVTGKQTMAAFNEQQFKEALSAAASVNAAEGAHEDQVAQYYDDARFYLGENYVGTFNF